MPENSLVNHIATIVSLSEEEIIEIMSYFNYQSFKRKITICREALRHLIFYGKRLPAIVFIDDLGNPKTIQFAIENWWISDLIAFQNF